MNVKERDLKGPKCAMLDQEASAEEASCKADQSWQSILSLGVKLETGVTRQWLEGCQTSRGRSRQDNWNWYRCHSLFDLGNSTRYEVKCCHRQDLCCESKLFLHCRPGAQATEVFPLSNAFVKKETEWRESPRDLLICRLLQVVKEDDTGFELWIGSLEETSVEGLHRFAHLFALWIRCLKLKNTKLQFGGCLESLRTTW